MATSSTSPTRRRTWDVTQLSSKYPWLRVDSETIDDFRSPFEWVPVGATDDEVGAKSDDADHDSLAKSTKTKPRRQHKTQRILGRSKKRYSHHHDQVQPLTSCRTGAIATNTCIDASQSVSTARSETETTRLPPATSPTNNVLTKEVYADFQSLKVQQRQRKANRKKRQASHTMLSLTLPSLHRPAQLPTRRQSLTHELERLTHEQAQLQKQVLAQIDAEKAKLPLTFLFERNLDKAYCKQQSVGTITSIFAKLQHRMIYDGFRRWVAWYTALLDEERRVAAIETAQRKALAFFERIASDAYVGTIARAFTKWRTTARALAAEEMRAAAVKIQNLYRQRRARSLLRDLKQASLDREYKRSHEIQRLLKFESYGTAMKWSTLRNGFNLVLQSLCARRIQYFFRRIRTKQRVQRRRQRNRAATKIQCRWRIRRARMERARLLLAREIRRERERAVAIHVQRRARGYLGRQHAALRRVQLSHENTSALAIQRAWRRYQERYKLVSRFKRRRQLLDEARAREDERQRIEAARRDAARREAMAIRIQRVARGFLGRQETRRRLRERAMEKAARRVQASWRKSKGRYVLHLRFVAQREKIEERRCAAVLLLQCRVRMLKARRIRDQLLQEKQRRRASAVYIQRVVRGRQARVNYARTRRSTVAIQSVWRGKLARQERERRRLKRELEEQQRFHATLRLQSVARGHRARRLTRQLRKEQQQMHDLLQQSAVLIQKRARGMEARKTAALLRHAMLVVDKQQKRAFSRSQKETPLLAFITKQYFDKSSGDDEEGLLRYSREQLEWIQWHIDAAIQQMKREDEAVLKMQHHYRGYATRMAFVVKLSQHQQRLRLENRMAIRLQRVARGFLARRRVHKIRAKRRGDELKEAYVRERKWKDQERAWQDQYKQEQMTLQLHRLQLLEKQIKDAKRDAEVARWQAEAAALRKQELLEQVEAKKLERMLRRQLRDQSSSEDEDDEADDAMDPAWQLLQDAYGNWYYYNANTGDSSWEQPIATSPFKKKTPKIKKQTDDKTSKVKPAESASASPSNSEQTKAPSDANIDKSKPPDTESVPPVRCSKCRTAPAVKECLECEADHPQYCASCFTLVHSLLPTKTRHDFKVLPSLQRKSECQSSTHESPALASYYCSSCDEGTRFSCEACFPQLHESAVTSHHIPSCLHFRRGALLCIECSVVLATRQCAQCDEAFCAGCYGLLHANTKSFHEYTPLEILKEDLSNERDAYCVECELKRCTKLCNLCGDGFCDACYDRAHSKGQKTSHTWLPWEQFAAHGDWLEIQDATSGRPVYFNIETKESTHTQPFVLKSGEERHRVLFQEREAAMKSKTLELESEIVKLTEQLQAIEKEKENEALRQLRRKTVPEGTDGTTDKSTKAKKAGLLSGLFGSKKTKSNEPATKKLTADEYKRLALQQSLAQSADDVALIHSKLTTRERQQKELQAKHTVGTKQFEQAVIDELARAPTSK